MQEVNNIQTIRHTFKPEKNCLAGLTLLFKKLNPRTFGTTHIEIYESQTLHNVFTMKVDNVTTTTHDIVTSKSTAELDLSKEYTLKIWSNTQKGTGLHFSDDYTMLYSDDEIEALTNTDVDETEEVNLTCRNQKDFIIGLISVVIPCYNSLDTIDSTLAALTKQTYNNMEIIVVDDASKNPKALQKILKKYKIKKYVKNKVNMKQGISRNIGEKHAVGEYLFFCDSDVELIPEAFQKFIQQLHDHPEAGWCYSNFQWGDGVLKHHEFDKARMYCSNCSSTMSMLRHKYFPGFDESLIKLEDWELFINIMEIEDVVGVWENSILFKTPWTTTGVTNGTITEKEARAILFKKHPKVVQV